MGTAARFTEVPTDAQAIRTRVLAKHPRLLLFGPPGAGKSTLAAALGAAVSRSGVDIHCLNADPGSPAFGAPGAACLARWDGGWRPVAWEGLCTLNAARFRLPLTDAVRRLATDAPAGPLLIDGPGTVRGVAGAELLTALVVASRVDAVLVLCPEPAAPPLAAELAALDCPVFTAPAPEAAYRPGKGARARQRTALWDRYLAGAVAATARLDALFLTGTPPPDDAPEAWAGRQVAVLESGRTRALGEVLDLEKGSLRLCLPRGTPVPRHLLVRDAVRTADGRLNTAEAFGAASVQYLPPPDVLPRTGSGGPPGPRPVARVGPGTAVLLNGVFGDPLLHLRLRHIKRSLLFDLGEAARLPARVAHQVSDVFISHAHMDHIGGFLWLLRSRIGEFPPVHLYGPPGLIGHVAGLLQGILWDRIGERGPRFEVAELHGTTVERAVLQAGQSEPEPLPARTVTGDVILKETGFSVRAVTLDHGTPSIAYAFEPALQINVRKERLAERGLEPGPWLAELKAHIAAGTTETELELPDGSRERVGALAEALTLIRPGQKLVYATDLADTAGNRARLTGLAAGAHTLFCEAAFTTADAQQAARTGHLTTRACGEIATAAGVTHLVPFHFSRRYEDTPEQVYAEVAAACSRVVVPPLEGSPD